jgi:hypothetical protein
MSNHDREGSYPSNRDATLERAWREASDEQPPAHLDAAIVAAARHAVGDRGEQPIPAPAREAPRTWLARWQPLAAAASIAGLAFVLVQMLPREHSRTPSLQPQESAPRATAEAPAQEAVPAPPTMPAAPVPTASKAEATASDSAAVLIESSADRHQAGALEMAGRVEPATAAAPAASAASAAAAKASERDLDRSAPLDAAGWAARIATLHAAGDVTAAEQALRDFRASEPQADTYLPESLRDWAQTVH